MIMRDMEMTRPWRDAEMVRWRGFLLAYECDPRDSIHHAMVLLPGGERRPFRELPDAKPPAMRRWP